MMSGFRRRRSDGLGPCNRGESPSGFNPRKGTPWAETDFEDGLVVLLCCLSPGCSRLLLEHAAYGSGCSACERIRQSSPPEAP